MAVIHALNEEQERTLLFAQDSIQEIQKMKEAALKIYQNYTERPKSIVVELNVYRKYAPIIVKYLLTLTRVNKAGARENERFYKPKSVNDHKRWDEEEDNALIEVICDGRMNMNEISIAFGRSPSAIASRVTTLVGIKRLSKEVAGKFVGKIDGIDTEAQINGTVYTNK